MSNLIHRAAFLFVLSIVALASNVASADLVRYVSRDKETGEYEEGTRAGTIEKFTRDGVSFTYDAKDEKKTVALRSEQIVWLQFDAEPLELGAARVEIQVGNYEEALDKIDAIEEGDVKTDMIAQEIEWNRVYATMKQALSGAGDLKNASDKVAKFIEIAPEHYRRYDAFALLGEAATASGDFAGAAKYYAELDAAKSESIKAIGKVGRARAALETNDVDEAKALFAEVADTDALDAQLEGLGARTTAKIGLADALARQKDYDGALKTLEALLAATPNSATMQQAVVYNALGRVYADAGRAEEAVVAYLHVDLLYPAARSERVKALKALVPLWEKLGRRDRARETRQFLQERFNVDWD
ncbi:MAG: tetratricopeptide repeat protein [Thermoguttaceae bacterium]|nr:tetratricopeptide repeat protein [Thermoguttaceae bacterium]